MQESARYEFGGNPMIWNLPLYVWMQAVNAQIEAASEPLRTPNRTTGVPSEASSG